MMMMLKKGRRGGETINSVVFCQFFSGSRSEEYEARMPACIWLLDYIYIYLEVYNRYFIITGPSGGFLFVCSPCFLIPPSFQGLIDSSA